jgi:CheY-like chemotaxis protein
LSSGSDGWTVSGQMNAQDVILLAEDSEDDELLFSYSWHRAHLDGNMIVVRDGDETVAYLQGKGPFADREKFPFPKALFLDLVMRKRSGWEVLQWIRNQPKFDHLQIAILTGSARAGDIQRAYKMGANSFLVKPCGPKDLINFVSTLPRTWPNPASGIKSAKQSLDAS